MDVFAFHPYPENSRTPATRTHPRTTTVGLADYGKLVGLLGRAFDGTAQPGSSLPIVYSEFGIETEIPPAAQRAYTGTEPPTTRPVRESLQARTYREAFALAFCQPTVRALFTFHTVDERDLNRLQTGVYYADGRSKASRAPLKSAVREVERGVVARCAGLRLRPAVTARFPDASAPGEEGVGFRLACDIDCTFTARVTKLSTGSTTAAVRGSVLGGRPRTVSFRPLRLAPGRYRITVAARAAVNVGATVTRTGPVLVLR
jgi:hypothetical protein